MRGPSAGVEHVQWACAAPSDDRAVLSGWRPCRIARGCPAIAADRWPPRSSFAMMNSLRPPMFSGVSISMCASSRTCTRSRCGASIVARAAAAARQDCRRQSTSFSRRVRFKWPHGRNDVPGETFVVVEARLFLARPRDLDRGGENRSPSTRNPRRRRGPALAASSSCGRMRPPSAQRARHHGWSSPYLVRVNTPHSRRCECVVASARPRRATRRDAKHARAAIMRCHGCLLSNCPVPARPMTLPASNTTSPRRIVVTGQPFTFQPS